MTCENSQGCFAHLRPQVSIINKTDPTAEKVFKDIEQSEYYEARFRYRELHDEEEDELDEKYDKARAQAKKKKERDDRAAAAAALKAKKQAE